MPQTAVLFDLDGVLVDSRAAIASCINHALASRGLAERPHSELHGFIGPPLHDVFAELTAEPVESPAVAACVTAYRDVYGDVSLRDTEVVPGVEDALDEVAAAGHRLAVATSKPRAFAEPILVALGLSSFFDVVAGPDLGALAETKAETIRSALGALGPVDAVMIGDRSFDVRGARTHGLPSIGVTWGIGDAEELAGAGADLIVESPAELAAAAERLLPRR